MVQSHMLLGLIWAFILTKKWKIENILLTKDEVGMLLRGFKVAFKKAVLV